MEPKKNIDEIKLPKGFTISPDLADNYDGQPYFKEQIERANHILKTYGIPKDFLNPDDSQGS